MKFSCTTEINKPIGFVSSHFQNTETMKHCQDGFKEIVYLSGEKGQVGSKAKLVYKKFDLFETILKNDLPNEFIGNYEHKHMTNTMKVNFEAIAENKTRYTSEIEYTQFNSIMIKVMAKLFPRMFKKQVQKWMDTFQVYVETN